MTAIFISHSSADNAAAAEMKAWLETQGHTSLFLDFDPEAGIKGGSGWEQTLYQQLRQCQAVIALLTPSWLASKWCFAELVQARERGKAIFPVKVQPCEAGGVFGDIQHIDLTAEPEEGYRRLKFGLLERGLDPQDVFNWDPKRPPYPGLLAFQEQDAAIFFGRGEEILKTLETLDALRRQGREAARFALLLGASGSGKSSLARAGVIPRLKKKPAEWLPLPPFRPQQEPLDELAMSLAAAFEGYGRPRDWSAIRTELHAAAQSPMGAQALLKLVRDLAIAAQQPETTVLLTIDQAEELFGYSPPEAATRFLRLLRAALEAADRRLMAIATLRSDFLGEFQNHAVLQDGEYPHSFRYQAVPVDPMPLRNFPAIIQGPARLAGVRLDDGLVETIVQDTGTRDALPLLAFTLRRLYERYGGDGHLSVEEYESLGRLEGAIREEAQRAIAEADPTPEELEALHAAFVPTMIRINAEGGYARRRALFAAMTQRAVPLLRRFVDARLLVTDRDPQGRETIEVAHEALLRTWPLLGGWLAEDQDKLRLLEGIQRSAEEWDQGGRRDDLLVHRNGRLKDAETLLANPRFTMPEASVERAYLDAYSAAQRSREAAEKEEQERRIRDAERIAEEEKKAAAAQKRTARASMIGLAVALLVAALAGWQYLRADHQARVATAQKLTAQARSHFDDQPDLAALLSVEASFLDDSPAVKGSLLDGLEHGARLQTFLRGHTASVRCVAFSHDGKLLASGGDDNMIRLWDAETWQSVGALPQGHTQSVWSVALSPDGSVLASGSADQTVRLWKVATREPLGQPLTGHAGPVDSVAFHPDGNTLISSSGEQESIHWNVTSLPPTASPFGAQYSSRVGKLAFSPDGRLLAIGSPHGISLWQPETQQHLGEPLETEGVLFQSLAFSQDSKTLVAANEMGITQWDLSGALPKPKPLAANVDFIQAVAISPDGKLLAGGGNDAMVRLWNLDTGQQLPRPLTGHTGHITSLGFHPDGATLVSGSEDGTIVVWNPTPRSPLRYLLRHPGGTIISAAFSRDDRLLATGSPDGTILIWNLRSGSLTRQQSIHTETQVTVLAFAGDSDTLMACDRDHQVRLWDINTGQPSGTPLSDVHCEKKLILTQDGRKVGQLDTPAHAGGEEDDEQTITVWDIQSRQVVSRSVVAGPEVNVNALSYALSSDGARLATGTDSGTVFLWNLRLPQAEYKEMPGHSGRVLGLAFSPDGALLASGSHDSTIRIWNVSKEQLQQPPLETPRRVNHLAFNGTGTTLVALYSSSLREPAALHMWDVQTGMAVGLPLTGTGTWADGNVEAFSRTGKWGTLIASDAEEDQFLLLWNLDVDTWRVHACRRANRNLSPTDEWPLYFPEQPYHKTCPALPLPISIPRVRHDVEEETFALALGLRQCNRVPCSASVGKSERAY